MHHLRGVFYCFILFIFVSKCIISAPYSWVISQTFYIIWCTNYVDFFRYAVFYSHAPLSWNIFFHNAMYFCLNVHHLRGILICLSCDILFYSMCHFRGVFNYTRCSSYCFSDIIYVVHNCAYLKILISFPFFFLYSTYLVHIIYLLHISLIWNNSF